MFSSHPDKKDSIYQGVWDPSQSTRVPSVNRAWTVNQRTLLPSRVVVVPGNSCFLKLSPVWYRENKLCLSANSYTPEHGGTLSLGFRPKENICVKVMKRLRWKVHTQAGGGTAQQTFCWLLPFLLQCFLYWTLSRLIHNSLFTSPHFLSVFLSFFPILRALIDTLCEKGMWWTGNTFSYSLNACTHSSGEHS